MSTSKITREKNLESVLTIVIGLLALYFFLGSKAYLSVAVVIGLSGLSSKFLAEKIGRAWLSISEILGKISSTVLLLTVYFAVLTPIAVLYRIFSSVRLGIKKNSLTSYYKDRGNYLFGEKDLSSP